MPKIVDHARRREEIAALTVRVIRTEGSASATIRRIATEGGFSIGVLGHYFKDKDDLVAFAFQWMATQSFKELDVAVAAAEPGLARLRAAMGFMVPAPGEPSFIAVWLSLWDGALKNPALARVHRAYYARWRRHLRRYVREAVVQGEIAPLESSDNAVDLLSAVIDGLWIGVTFEPGRYPLRRRRELVSRALRDVLGAD
ncbi:MAG: TetR family transcriptional regulator C-terminal domain-containing protein [Proteobacteria bacterium]|nr:TetR family transcriptional regulator C-terminal domain-containing protein [Pseudomonadota bacterium]